LIFVLAFTLLFPLVGCLLITFDRFLGPGHQLRLLFVDMPHSIITTPKWHFMPTLPVWT
jgi:hypothetical protein